MRRRRGRSRLRTEVTAARRARSRRPFTLDRARGAAARTFGGGKRPGPGAGSDRAAPASPAQASVDLRARAVYSAFARSKGSERFADALSGKRHKRVSVLLLLLENRRTHLKTSLLRF